MKQTYAFDIDDTLCYFAPAAVAAMNKAFNKSFEPPTNYNIHGMYGATLEKFLEVLLEQEVYENLEPYPEAIPLLNNLLSQDVDLLFVTARSGMGSCAYPITKTWIEKKLGIKDFGLHIQDPLLKKVTYFDSTVTTFVEDNYKHLHYFSGSKYLVHQPWNFAYVKPEDHHDTPILIQDQKLSVIT